MDKVGFGGDAPEHKINFCLKWSKGVQMGPKLHEKMAVFWHYLAMNGKSGVRKKFSPHPHI